MRADRLVAVLLLLQRRTQVTAREVAEELEVSERTARRDLEALGTAGLPVYSIPGRNGGWRLLGDGRTDLSGLTAEEARSLVVALGTAAYASATTASALRKLIAASPAPIADRMERTEAVTVIAPDRWENRSAAPRLGAAPAALDAIHTACLRDECLVVAYRDRAGRTSERRVDPLAVVSQGPWWYLLCATAAGDRTLRIDRVASVAPTGEHFTRPDDFDAARAWESAVARIDDLRAPIVATGTVDPVVVDHLRWVLGRRLTIVDAGPPTTPDPDPDPDGPVPAPVAVVVRGHSIESLAAELAGLGGRVRIEEPAALRRALGAIGAELSAIYVGAWPDPGSAGVAHPRRDAVHGEEQRPTQPA